MKDATSGPRGGSCRGDAERLSTLDRTTAREGGRALPTNADLRRKPPFQPVKPFLRQTGPPSARSGVTLGSHPARDPPNPDEPRGSAMITGLSRAHH